MTPMSGGGQEHGCRSGTENVPSIVAAAVALEHMLGNPEIWIERVRRVTSMRNSVHDHLVKNLPGLTVNGDPRSGMYNILSVTLPAGVAAADVVRILDSRGMQVGSGSACNKGRPSENLIAMGRTPAQAAGTLRISLSEFNTHEQCRALALVICEACRALVPGR
jgi:cysteine desulfurase